MSYLEAEASSKACQTCKMIMHIQSPGHSQNNLFKHFQRYLGIFRDMMHIQPLSKTHNYGEQKRPGLPFLKSKICHDFGKKGPEWVHLSVKFTIQNVVLRVSRRKISTIFPGGKITYFSCVFDEMLIEVP